MIEMLLSIMLKNGLYLETPDITISILLVEIAPALCLNAYMQEANK